MVQLVICHGVRHFIPSSAFWHIQAFEAVLPSGILAHPDKLNTTYARVLPCVFCKSLCFTQIIFKLRIMRLQNIYHISKNIILPNDDKIRKCRFEFVIDFIRYAKRPRASGRISNPANKIVLFFFFLNHFHFPCVQLHDCNTCYGINK